MLFGLLWCACKPGLAPAGDLLFFVSPKKPKEKKGDPMVWVPPLRFGQPAVLNKSGVRHKLGYRLRQVPALIRFCLRSSAQPDGWGERMRTRGALTHSAHQGVFQFAVMFARGSSTRGQMKSPSIAQRGEGGVRGGSGELDPTARNRLKAQRDA